MGINIFITLSLMIATDFKFSIGRPTCTILTSHKTELEISTINAITIQSKYDDYPDEYYDDAIKVTKNKI